MKPHIFPFGLVSFYFSNHHHLSCDNISSPSHTHSYLHSATMSLTDIPTFIRRKMWQQIVKTIWVEYENENLDKAVDALPSSL